jgi:hypothetical protein
LGLTAFSLSKKDVAKLTSEISSSLRVIAPLREELRADITADADTAFARRFCRKASFARAIAESFHTFELATDCVSIAFFARVE